MSFIINEELKRSIETFEKAIRQLETTIFDGGAFCASKISQNLGLAKNGELLEKARRENVARMNSAGYGGLANSMGFGQRSYQAPTLAEKKDYYLSSFDEFGDIIIPIRDCLKKFLEKVPDEWVRGLVERSEKCIRELDNLRNIVRGFY
jgi:hypothetical protein